ncbi:Leucine-rich repeat - like 10 [Theobroma cacao]|nr:Leucine-rich repeat - like 10 [Theobroma cacao]
MESLETLILSGCSKLEHLADFTMTKNLKSLNLEGCTSLVDVHPSIAFLPKLELLNLRDCKCIWSLPAKFGMESLETLILSGCTNLQRFPEITKKMELLQELYLDGTSIEELPSSIGDLSSLKVLNLSSCSVFENLPPSFLQRIYKKGCRVLLPSLNPTLFKKSPNSIALTLTRFSGLSSLTELNISGRNLCEGALPNDICCLSSLETLILTHNNFVSLPANLCQLTKLLRLELWDCKKLESLPELPSSIKAVGLGGCASLEIVPNPTKPYNPWKRRSYNPIWSKAYCYSVNCFKLVGNDNALGMLKGHIKAIAKAKTIFDMLIPGSKIFEWFNHQSEEGSVMISMPPNLQNDGDQWMGIAVCCVFVPPSNNDDWIRDLAMCTVIIHSIDFQHRLPTYGFNFHSDSHRILKDHLWLGYLPRDIVDYFWNDESGDCKVKKCIGIKILFETLGIGPKVKKCGARLVYRSNMEDMDPTIEQSSTPTSTNFSDIHQDSTDGLSKKRKRYF